MNKKVAEDLLNIKAVQIRTDDYFTWTSGIKSPIYCDNRLTMSYPKVRKNIIEAFVQLVNKLPEKPDVIAGCATAGIPHAAWLAEALDLPMVYVRSEKKSHGKQNQIEGHFNQGDKVVVIEDLISTGGSAIDAALALREAGATVDYVLAIFSYRLQKSIDQFNEANLLHETITSYDHMLQILMDEQQITSEERNTLEQWRNNL